MKQVVRRWLGAVCFISLAGVFASNHALGSSTPCGKRDPRTYGHIVRQLEAPLPKFPPDDYLPFAPNAMLKVSDADHVLLSGEKVGYELKLNRRTSHQLHWQVSSVIQRLNDVGRAIEVVMGRHQFVTGGRNTTLKVARKVKSGLYRLDVQISDRKGRRLGSFFAVFNVLPRHLGVRISSSGSHFAPGSNGSWTNRKLRHR